jgi:hypothetical protein
VKLLLGFEGSDASTTFTDESSAAKGNGTVSGNAQVDTAQFKFGSASGLFDGTTDRITFPDSGDWHLGTANFTVELWVRFNSLTNAIQQIVGVWETSPNLSWVLRRNTGDTIIFAVSTTGADNFIDVTVAWTPTLATWYHICVDYDGTKYRLYRDGSMIASSTTARNIFNASAELAISSTIASRSVDGWIDELRITPGVARYASDGGFSVPTAAYPRS